MKYFADCHFHVMTMKEPNFAAFLSSFNTDIKESVSGSKTKNYIITPESILKNQFMSTVQNTLTAFTRPIGETFLMMENDLVGKYIENSKSSDAPLLPFYSDGEFHYRDKSFKKILLCPLLMDFSQTDSQIKTLYYQFKREDKITPYAEDTIEGMKYYYANSQYHLFEFYPLLGINTPAHDLDFIKALFQKYVNVSHTFHDEQTVPEKPFYGIKIYPPLGFNPWPSDKEEMKKVRYVYDFCSLYGIPIITHCDDQGFRGVPVKEAWHYTSPATWRTALENYPNLILDFAHMGKQYSPNIENAFSTVQYRLKKWPTSEWFYLIMDLMKDFPNIYADISFTAALTEFFPEFWNYFSAQNEEMREKIQSHMLFGSDFSVNLLKTESYSSYYHKIETSIFSDEFIDAISSINPIEFLGLKELQLEDKTQKSSLLSRFFKQ